MVADNEILRLGALPLAQDDDRTPLALPHNPHPSLCPTTHTLHSAPQPTPFTLPHNPPLPHSTAAACARNTCRCTFPVGVFGSSPTNRTIRGYLYGAIVALT